ncbi:MAG: hypothetical protein IT428_00095 [Planctomycetaceae bacterium]|nr:hypothetical protein [Planctomycetaceae bacterium]
MSHLGESIELTPKDEAIALALASGKSRNAVADECGVTTRTVYRKMLQPAFRERVRQLRVKIVDENAARLSASGAEAIETLGVLLKSPTPPAVRLGAARAIIELGVKLRESVELEERIARLEEARNGQS